MKKKLISIIAVTMIAVITAVSLAACKSSNPAASASSSSKSSTQTKMLAQWKTDLAELVKDGTINQSQSDDILKTLSSMNQQFGNRSGSRPSGTRSGSRPSGNWSGSRPSWSGSRPSGSWSGSRPSGSSGGFGLANLLSSLVQQGVITQDQADAVTKKLFSGMRPGAPGSSSSSSSAVSG